MHVNGDSFMLELHTCNNLDIEPVETLDWKNKWDRTNDHGVNLSYWMQTKV